MGVAHGLDELDDFFIKSLDFWMIIFFFPHIVTRTKIPFRILTAEWNDGATLN